ncbi:MAG: hypothetical protein AAFX87_02225 [Bacteroidota bacterium]
MKKLFKKGDKKTYETTVSDKDFAGFHGQVVHEVYATYALGRDIEWSSRLFVLEMTEEDEEGIGTFLTINHKSPAFLGDNLVIEAVVNSFEGNELICDYEARVGQRVVAEGQTGQKILKKERIEKLFSNLKHDGKEE